MDMNGRVLIVAGSDSGGGAGIQADIKTVTCLGGFAATAVTALTAQNTLGVEGVHPVPPAFIQQQMRVVLSDLGADCIKTGMLHDRPTIEAVAEVLDAHPDIPLVVDPVMVAQSGARLLHEDAVDAVLERLVPRAAVVTPNAPEAAALTGRPVNTCDDLDAAAQTLVARGAAAALVKGGHLEGDTLCDVLATAEEVHSFESHRIPTQNTHGTGCTLGSAIAAGLAQGRDLLAAVERARAYLHGAIELAPELGQGDGPVNHAWTVRPFQMP